MELERPQVTITGGPPRDDEPDVLVSAPEPLVPRVLEGVRRVAAWEPRRGVLRALTAGAAAVLVAGAASAVALELRPPSLDPAAVVEATLAEERYRVDLRTEVPATTDAGPQTVTGVVDVDLRRDAYRLSYGAGQDHAVVEVIGIGDVTWSRFRAAGVVGVRWQREERASDGARSIGTAAGLRELLGGATRVRDLPADEVDGVAVRRVLVRVPLDADDRDGGDGGATLEQDRSLEAEMSVDGEGRLRRLVVDDLDGGDGGEPVRSSLVVSRFGADPRIEPPADEDVAAA